MYMLLYTGNVTHDLAVDSTLHRWISAQPPVQRLHSVHQDTMKDATPDNLHHICTVSEHIYNC